MREFEAKVQKWGNSYGIRIPKEAIVSEKLRENAPVKVLLRSAKGNNLQEFFGLLKSSHLDAQKLKDEFRAEEARAWKRKHGNLF